MLIKFEIQYEKFANYLNQQGGHSIPSLDALPYLHGPASYATTSNNRPVSYGSSSTVSAVGIPLIASSGPYTRENINIPHPPQLRGQPLQLQHFQPLSPMEKMMMSETALNAVSEVVKLIQVEEPMWINSSIDGRLLIDQENYEKLFTKINHFKIPSARIESSKEVVMIPMDARNLIDVFLDTVRTYVIYFLAITSTN